MKLNVKAKSTFREKTHEGAPAVRASKIEQLRRSVLTCLLWESNFYEDGMEIGERIASLVKECKPIEVANLAIEARTKYNLRHVPLLLVREMARYDSHKPLVENTLVQIIQRPDELCEFLAIYWKEGKCPIAKCIQRGLAKAFLKFNEFQLSKWNKDSAIKLRDVMFLVHPKPITEEQEAVFERLAEKRLVVSDTWEVSLSKNDGVDKKTKWTRLLTEGKLGAMALLMNLRNMTEAGVEEAKIRAGIKASKTEKMFPYRFISAANHNKHLEDVLETKMIECLQGMEKLSGKTLLLVDISGSMGSMNSGMSELSCADRAYGLAMLARELCEEIEVYSFSSKVVRISPRHGFALREAIDNSQQHGGTNLGKACDEMFAKNYDRLIVVTDEQSSDRVNQPKTGKNYMINIANCKNGVGYNKWVHIDGWSDKVFWYIQEVEKKQGELK